LRENWLGFSEVPPYEEAERIGRTLIKDFADEEIDELKQALADFKKTFETSSGQPLDKAAEAMDEDEVDQEKVKAHRPKPKKS
jgi:F0F1-type ATP synthase gamma subunit